MKQLKGISETLADIGAEVRYALGIRRQQAQRHQLLEGLSQRGARSV